MSAIIDRRTALLALAGAASTPAAALPQRAVDVAVIGGGAAGIAAARTLVRAGLSTMIVEAGSRIGGRCVTDRVAFDAPVDVGAHWLHGAEQNPLSRLGRDLGFELYEETEEEVLQVAGRAATEAEGEAYARAIDEAEQSIVRFGWRPDDGPAIQGLPRDLGEWRASTIFRLGAYEFGKPLSEISSWDFARAQQGGDLVCRQGFGALLRATARGLPVALGATVDGIRVAGDEVRISTALGTLRARAAIVTVSIGVLAAGTIRFEPGLSDLHLSAIDGLGMGSTLRVLVEIAGNPLDVDGDQAVFQRADNDRTFGAVARVGGTNVWYLDAGGPYARDLEAQGDAVCVEAARDWLAAGFGGDVRGQVGRTMVSRWNRSHLSRGSISVAQPGRAVQRAVFRQPHAERILFAGEHRHDTLWGTVAGAWETGEIAAGQAIDLVRR